MALISTDSGSDKFEVLEVIGRGSFGIIRKVRRKSDGHVLCRKEINYLKMSVKERDQLSAEFSILSSLRHENIVGYFHREHLKHSQELYLYMEYCGGGDLGTVIKKLQQTGEYAKEEFVWRIFSQLITALYRCHYGIDAPEPGSDPSQQKDPRLALKGKNQSVMILHRDLKPENIFLGEDQSVKLGDFGLSKLMHSNDFASTYVGTPFYMSPEICNAEKYTLQSDIWSVGCIIYELCTREPPFNAKTHMQLIQKIRKGDFKPIPSIYSRDLQNVISNCLKTNPLHRPDTASLLTIPYVWIARKAQEMVNLGKALQAREEVADRKLKEADDRLTSLDADRVAIHAEINAVVRREWEVKAHLEVDRQVKIELERLRRKFDKEVEDRVAMLVAKQDQSNEKKVLQEIQNPSLATFSKENLNPHSSVTTASGEEDFPSTTDLTDLSDISIHSASTSASKTSLPSKRGKTPFTRSKTNFDSPADVQMSEPSPMSISSLALSPRRLTIPAAKNIFDEAARQRERWEPTLAYASDDDDGIEDSDSENADLLSPTRPKMATRNTDPFKMPFRPRPGIMRQNTMATMQKLTTQPTLFPSISTAGAQVKAGIAAGLGSAIPRSAAEIDVKPTVHNITSPNRRLSKIPSRGDLLGDNMPTSPTRKMTTQLPSKTGLVSKLAKDLGGDEMLKAVHQRNMVSGPVHHQQTNNPHHPGGRTLVELAQARAGGRPVSTDFGGVAGGKAMMHRANASMENLKVDRERELPPVPIWDPEMLGDDMPSPFLKREVKVLRGLR